MKNPFKYKDQKDWLEATKLRETQLSNFDASLDRIVHVHQKLMRGYRMNDQDWQVIDASLNQLITDLFHKRAEQVYLLEQMGVEDETNGEVGGGDSSPKES